MLCGQLAYNKLTKKRLGQNSSFSFLAFATKNRNCALARFRFFLCSSEMVFLHLCPSLFFSVILNENHLKVAQYAYGLIRYSQSHQKYPQHFA